MLSQFFRPLPQTHPLLSGLQRLRVGIKVFFIFMICLDSDGPTVVGYAKKLSCELRQLHVCFQKEPYGKGAQGGIRVSKAVRNTVPRVADA